MFSPNSDRCRYNEKQKDFQKYLINKAVRSIENSGFNRTKLWLVEWLAGNDIYYLFEDNRHTRSSFHSKWSFEFHYDIISSALHEQRIWIDHPSVSQSKFLWEALLFIGEWMCLNEYKLARFVNWSLIHTLKAIAQFVLSRLIFCIRSCRDFVLWLNFRVWHRNYGQMTRKY